MLTTLRIKNLALVEDLVWEPRKGLNVITGETGAGKSVLLGGLQLLLGQRADRGMIRSGADQCTVEAIFHLGELRDPLNAWLTAQGLEATDEGQLVIRRSFNLQGTNRQFINGSPTTVGTLARLGDFLVDLHGPHEHQSLLQTSKQLAILDAHAGLDRERAAMADGAERHKRLLNTRSDLDMDDATYAQRLDLLRYQVREIGEARLDSGEESVLEETYQRISNAARLQELSQAALDLLGEREGAILEAMGGLGRLLQELSRLDASSSPLAEQQQMTMEQLNDLQHALSRYLEGIEVDPEHQLQLEQRLHLIQNLKRKYGGSVESVLRFGHQVELELEALEGREEELARLNRQLQESEKQVLDTAARLSRARKAALSKLEHAVCAELESLGFHQSRFEVSLTPTATWNSSGQDQIEFLFAPNPGEPARPLRAIASSGELARVMLALKTVLALQDEVPVLVFDEVDANVGGETAHVVGQKMARIARSHQVLCITHLPQVASSGDAHFLVEKEVTSGRTLSRLTELNRSQRVAELTRMLGGGKAARSHAEALLKETVKSE